MKLLILQHYQDEKTYFDVTCTLKVDTWALFKCPYLDYKHQTKKLMFLLSQILLWYSFTSASLTFCE